MIAKKNKAKEFDLEEMERDVKLVCKCPLVSSGNSTKSLSVFSQLAGFTLCSMKQT